MTSWQTITHLGSSGILLPVSALLAAALWQAGQKTALCRWLAGLLAAVALTLATKIAFMGWGIGIRALDFTGISGHTLLATTVLPMLGASLMRDRRAGLLSGLAAALLVAASRVVLGMHSVSEVAVAWLLGAAVAWLAMHALRNGPRLPRFSHAAPLLLLLAFDTSAATYLPSHEIEIRIALALSGRDMPFTRATAP